MDKNQLVISHINLVLVISDLHRGRWVRKLRSHLTSEALLNRLTNINDITKFQTFIIFLASLSRRSVVSSLVRNAYVKDVKKCRNH